MKILFQPKYYLNFIFYLSWINLVSSVWFTILSNIYNTCLKSYYTKILYESATRNTKRY